MKSLGGVFDDPSAETVPTSIESVVERALFDVICGFSSGTRERMDRGDAKESNENDLLNSRSSKKKSNQKGKALKVSHGSFS